MNILQQCQAESVILSYKLDKIRNYIESRIKIVDPIAKNELSVILNMISEFETVPAGWSLETPLVPLNEEEFK